MAKKKGERSPSFSIPMKSEVSFRSVCVDPESRVCTDTASICKKTPTQHRGLTIGLSIKGQNALFKKIHREQWEITQSSMCLIKYLGSLKEKHHCHNLQER